MAEHYEVIVIGAGQAGLCMSYCLHQRGYHYLVLERSGQMVDTWRNQRWDSFTIVTPNSFNKLPGYAYTGDAPDGYMRRDELVAWFEAYAAIFDPPIRYNSKVLSVASAPNGGGFIVSTPDRTYLAANVIVATGILQSPHIPDAAEAISHAIMQLHTSRYRNPDQLPPGNVLVVGTGQSGCQIAEELYKSGRRVYLCVGSNGRIPRRYRGRDVYAWIGPADINTSTVDKFSNHAHVTGKDGGYELNLHQFTRDGVVLLGHLLAAHGVRISLAPDLMESLRQADQFYEEYKQAVDAYIAREGIDAPADTPQPVLTDGFDSPVIEELDLRKEGITCVIWATGYRYDFSWVHAPVFDARGFPRQERGITDIPGLYFLGMNWEHRPKSAFIGAVGPEAETIADHIGARLNETL